MNRVLQPRPLIVLELNVWMGTAAGADELVEIPADVRRSPPPSGNWSRLFTFDVECRDLINLTQEN